MRIELYEEEILDDKKPFILYANNKFKNINRVYNWFSDNLKIIMPETKLVMFEVAGEDDCCD